MSKLTNSGHSPTPQLADGIDCATDPMGSLKTMFVNKVMGNRLARGQNPALRPVFLKTHGIAGGVFRICPDLPSELRSGLFAQPEYPMVMRFSSDTLPSVSDSGTTLGVGIKLFGVPGEKLLHPAAATCDFVMQNHSVFFVNTARDMCEFTRAGVVEGNYQPYLDAHPITAQILQDMQSTESSALLATYWGLLPHAFGPGQCVKYKLMPRPGSQPDHALDNESKWPNYLYFDLKTRLLRQPAEFQFFIQWRKNAATMPLDEATILWREEESPPLHVATLFLPPQNIDAPGQAAFGENLAFNIWQTLPQNEPQGSIAAARKVVYAAAAELRSSRNQAPLDEPDTPLTIQSPTKPLDQQIVRAAIYPAIGIARVGNSVEPGSEGYFVGPELPESSTLPQGKYKDGKGALKRQAARFRIFGYNAAGDVVAELTSENAVIEWTAHLANKKAAWYQFQLALDIPEASAPGAPLSARRNVVVVGTDRRKLVIDPGPRSIHGCGTEGSAYHFDGAKFFDLEVPLGELRTDEQGRLLVLGGFGKSQSAVNQPPQEFANNDGWHDDVADGPVDAVVVIDGRNIPVEGAWVIVGPPNYAPGLKTVRTLYDLLYDRMINWGLLQAPGKVYFQKHIRPIFERLSGLQWVNQGFAAWFGAGAPNEAARIVPRLADNSEGNRQFRQRIFEQFRNPANHGRNLGKALWPQFFGDALDSLSSVTAENPDASLKVPLGLASLTATQLGWLEKWAEGNFMADLDSAIASPGNLADVPLSDQPALLTEGALSYCLADAFHPGCELTWIIRSRWLYDGSFRIRRKPANYVEPDYGEALSPEVAVSPMGPLNGALAGDLTRWMAVPWQTDTASCLSGYSFFRTSPSLPTFWPARVPNQVLRAKDFEEIVMNASKSASDRQAAFQRREDWFRVFVGGNDIQQMITGFHQLGIIEEREGPKDLPGVPGEVWVESTPNLPDPINEGKSGRDLGEVKTVPEVLPGRYHLRKFGKAKPGDLR